MEGNGNNPTRKDAGVPPTTLVLTVTLDQLTGAVNVTGPIHNLLIVYGMLEAAKDSCRRYVEQNQSRIIPGVSVPQGRIS